MTPTEQDKELRDILSKVLLDGQNQIHDLKDMDNHIAEQRARIK